MGAVWAVVKPVPEGVGFGHVYDVIRETGVLGRRTCAIGPPTVGITVGVFRAATGRGVGGGTVRTDVGGDLGLNRGKSGRCSSIARQDGRCFPVTGEQLRSLLDGLVGVV